MYAGPSLSLYRESIYRIHSVDGKQIYTITYALTGSEYHNMEARRMYYPNTEPVYGNLSKKTVVVSSIGTCMTV